LAFTGCLQIGGVTILYIFRFLQGAIAGIFMSFIPAYIGELTPKEIGSRFGVYPQLSVVLGVLFAYTLGMIITNCFNYESLPTNVPVPDILIESWQAEVFWRVMLGMAALPNLIQLLFVFIGYIPESPSSLILKNRREEARDVLGLFYEEEYVNVILEEREKEIFEHTNDLDDNVKWTGKGYYLGFQIAVFQALTGIAAYVTQTGHVVSVTLSQPIFGLYTPIVITIGQLVGTFISVPMLQYIEWKSLTLIGGFSLSLLNALIGMFFYFYEEFEEFKPYALTFAVVLILAYMFTFGITVGSSVWPYVSYMMPSNAVLIAQVVNWILAGFTILSLSFDVNATSYPYAAIWVFAGITFVLSVLNWIFMINIKGLSVVKVQEKLATE
jgi:MFS transporter, SP family, xylose:H+ symportor